ncbi:hypothetical protein QQS21_004143 [Conoideocrella luteorostrata]|uniref:Phospholipid methyltransferase n=1 Tax=Conoideocrella luteorostrata TaxID=1105319 RepID=A0AAJ0FVR3_9HYPO|nr:hypothetical protein QQS21_004143 [Conoideocrella luteorostrata]
MSFAYLQLAVVTVLQPWLMIGLSAALVPYTIVRVILSGNFQPLFSPSDFSEELFSNVWVILGPQAKAGAQDLIIPLLEGKVSGGKVHKEVVSVPLHGTVLEVGAGTGEWADVLARIHAGETANSGVKDGLRSRKKVESAGAITKIYGVEPGAHQAAALRKRVRDVGLGDVYEVVPVGIESVPDSSAWDGKIEPGSVDCIVGIRCMCSIPEPEKNIELLYKLLKPGGSWYIFEHVKTSRGAPLVPLYQRFVNSIWMWFMGSCRLCRTTDQTLRQVGTWKKFDLTMLPDEPAYSVLPHVIGVLTK